MKIKKKDSFIEYTDGFLKKLKIVQLKKAIYKNMEEMGKELYEIYMEYKEIPQKANDMYGFESFNALLQAPEESGGIDFSRQTAYQMLRVYKTYVIDLNCKTVLQNIDYAKLDIIRPVIDLDNKDEWFSKAKALARGDLRIEVNEALGRETKEMENYIICPECNFKFKL
jgi:hypothetical protein